MNTYILQKDLPDGSTAGDEYITLYSGNDSWYVNSSKNSPSVLTRLHKIYIENNPEWFKVKEEKAVIRYLEPHEVRNLEDKYYQFESSVVISKEKYSSICKAIEFILNKNGEVNEYPSYEASFAKLKKYTEKDMLNCWVEALSKRDIGFTDYIKSLNK